MLNALNIRLKLGLSFLAICVAAAAMMAFFFSNMSLIEASTKRNNESQAIHADALTLETSLLRQNSQMRGYLVTGDATYLKSYGEARDEYDSTSAALEQILTDPAQKAALLKSRSATLEWRARWGDRLIKRVAEGAREAAQDEVRRAGAAVLTSAAVLPLRDIRSAQVELIKTNSDRQDKAIADATTALIVGGLVLIGVAITLAVTLTRLIASPIARLTQIMGNLAAGRNDINVPDGDRGDEVGAMARAVIVFRDAAISKAASDAEKAASDAAVQLVVATLGASLSELSNRDLTTRVKTDFPGMYAALKENYNSALDNVSATVLQVSEGAAHIRVGSEEIAQASEDLARRTESNAASLQQASTALAEVESRLRITAESAKVTVARADEAKTSVQNGRDTAETAMQAMSRVSSSAKGIDSVIEGVDKIAFQTRVLAMNAAVEAGRAGDAGRGFAVVADLVSALAMRAEEEAKRARMQLTVTQAEIVTAVEAVQTVDGALSDISGSVEDVHKLLANMADDNVAQSATITEIAGAVSSMDKTTQQNAAMVEQTSAAARNLTAEVNGLSEAAAQFKLGARQGLSPSSVTRKVQAIRPAPAAQPRPSHMHMVKKVISSAAVASNDWSDF